MGGTLPPRRPPWRRRTRCSPKEVALRGGSRATVVGSACAAQVASFIRACSECSRSRGRGHFARLHESALSMTLFLCGKGLERTSFFTHQGRVVVAVASRRQRC